LRYDTKMPEFFGKTGVTPVVSCHAAI